MKELAALDLIAAAYAEIMAARPASAGPQPDVASWLQSVDSTFPHPYVEVRTVHVVTYDVEFKPWAGVEEGELVVRACESLNTLLTCLAGAGVGTSSLCVAGMETHDGKPAIPSYCHEVHLPNYWDAFQAPNTPGGSTYAELLRFGCAALPGADLAWYICRDWMRKLGRRAADAPDAAACAKQLDEHFAALFAARGFADGEAYNALGALELYKTCAGRRAAFAFR